MSFYQVLMRISALLVTTAPWVRQTPNPAPRVAIATVPVWRKRETVSAVLLEVIVNRLPWQQQVVSVIVGKSHIFIILLTWRYCILFRLESEFSWALLATRQGCHICIMLFNNVYTPIVNLKPKIELIWNILICRFYCELGSNHSRSIECPVGHYCPEGSGTPTPCLRGTYTNTPGNANISQCVQCDAGKYCNGTGKNTTQHLPLTLMLLVANLANTKWCKKLRKWLKP